MKDKIKLLLTNIPFLYQFAGYLYNFLKHPERMMKRYSNKDFLTDGTAFVVRPNSEDGIQGLLSLASQSLRWVDYANKKGYVPIVDYKNYNTQYGNGRDNAWEYFFQQPGEVGIELLDSYKDVVISGVTLKSKVDMRILSGDVFFNNEIFQESARILHQFVAFSKDVNETVDKEAEQINIEECIGVYIRGTDYTMLKPTGEFVQPDIEDVIKVLDDFVNKYDTNLFLVTEDYNNYKKLSDHFGSRVMIVSFDSFIKDYNSNTYLSKSGVLGEDKRTRGIQYLAKIVLLSKCRFLVSSITKGSIFAYCLNNHRYEDEYIFNLGVYR